MAMKKVSVTLDVALVTEAKIKLGDQAFSSILNDALALYLQGLRLQQLERDLTVEFGPIPEEVRAQVRLEWQPHRG